MKNDNELWIIEWSEVQKQFHMEPLRSRLEDNLHVHFFKKQKRSEWVAIGITTGMKKASDFIEFCAKKRGLLWIEEKMKWKDAKKMKKTVN